jgi:hypothetical protein
MSVCVRLFKRQAGLHNMSVLPVPVLQGSTGQRCKDTGRQGRIIGPAWPGGVREGAGVTGMFIRRWYAMPPSPPAAYGNDIR